MNVSEQDVYNELWRRFLELQAKFHSRRGRSCKPVANERATMEFLKLVAMSAEWDVQRSKVKIEELQERVRLLPDGRPLEQGEHTVQTG